MLHIFNNDAFGVLRLTSSVSMIPFKPGRLGSLGIFDEESVDTIDIAVEEEHGVLYLVADRERGADGTQNQKEGRKTRVLRANHLPVNDKLYAREVQGVRQFGSENELEGIQLKVNRKLRTMTQSLETTLEYHRVGAVKGQILDADGTRVLRNLFSVFEITPYDTVNFDFDPDAADTGQQRARCAQITRNVANALGMAAITGLHAICGDNFFDDLLKEPEVRNSYKGTSMAQVLREGYVYPNGVEVYGAFEFGGIVWENYRGSVGGVSFVDTEACHIFPVGVEGLFKTAFAPADYIETANKINPPIVAKVTPDPKGKFVDIDAEMNPLVYCTRPKALITGVAHT